MKRKFLEDLGLEKDVIDKIMDENGKDINAEKEKLQAKDEELKAVQDQLKEANDTIGSYQDMNLDEVKQAAKDWEEKYNQAQADLISTQQGSLLEKELAKVGSLDPDVLGKLIDREKLTFDDGKVLGLSDQIKDLKEAKPYLFEGSGNGLKSHEPESSGGETSPMMAEIDSIFSN